MLVVMALGRTALLKPGQAQDAATQRCNLQAAADAVAEIARQHTVVVTHGSAPQVGMLSYEDTLVYGAADSTLDVLSAQAEGLIGYLLQQELANRLRERDVVTILTQVVVSPGDPAFASPSKPVGPALAEVDARRLRMEHGWQFVPDGGRFRRVVASPEPLAVVERRTLELLVGAGAVVICAGGGGVPVTLDNDGALHGVDAVIDKDLTAAVVADLLGADVLMLLTDVPAVCAEWGTAFARPIHWANPAYLRTLSWDATTMGTKVTAACRFAERTGRRAAIGSIADAGRLLTGERGTQITVDTSDATWHALAPVG